MSRTAVTMRSASEMRRHVTDTQIAKVLDRIEAAAMEGRTSALVPEGEMFDHCYNRLRELGYTIEGEKVTAEDEGDDTMYVVVSFAEEKTEIAFEDYL
jgi:hypothetical protein